ncbi:MAG TPA: hypothetical protein VEV40_17515 [Alloacidobacterium sp.]|nr:hypothetical protein [Alloacidobacterium sp.]
MNQFTKVLNKVLLGAAIALAQAIEVSVIELLELQAIVLKIKCFSAQTANTQWQNYTSGKANSRHLSLNLCHFGGFISREAALGQAASI